MSSIDPDKVAGAIDVLSRLTWAKLFRLMVAAVLGACLFIAFEQRAQVLTDLRTSPTLGIVMACAFLLLVLCAAFAGLQSRVDERTEAWHAALSEQIVQLKDQIAVLHTEVRECNDSKQLILLGMKEGRPS